MIILLEYMIILNNTAVICMKTSSASFSNLKYGKDKQKPLFSYAYF